MKANNESGESERTDTRGASHQSERLSGEPAMNNRRARAMIVESRTENAKKTCFFTNEPKFEPKLPENEPNSNPNRTQILGAKKGLGRLCRSGRCAHA